MAPTAISTEMLHYFFQLAEAEQESIVNMLRTFVDAKQTSTNSSSLQVCNQEVEQADAEVDAGKFVSHEEVMRMHFS